MFIDLAAKAVEQIPGAAVGFVAGCFVPSVLRKIHAFIVKEATAIKVEAEKLASEITSKKTATTSTAAAATTPAVAVEAKVEHKPEATKA